MANEIAQETTPLLEEQHSVTHQQNTSNATTIFSSDSSSEPEDEQPARFSLWDAFLIIIKKCLAMGLSFTFCFELVFSLIMLYLLSDNPVQEAASGLSATVVNSGVLLGFGGIFGVGFIARQREGSLRAPSASGEPKTSTELSVIRRHITEDFRRGLIGVAGLSAIIIPIFYFSEPILVNIFGQPRAVARVVQSYTRLYSLAVPFIGLRALLEQMMLAFMRAFQAMMIALPSLAVGTVLAIYFAFIQGSGLYGVAAGFIIEAVITSLLFGAYMGWHPDFREYRFFNLFDPFTSNNRQEFKVLLKTGGTILFGLSNEALIMFATSILTGLLGTQAQSIWVSALLVNALTVIFSAAFAFGTAQEVGGLLGERRHKDARTMAKAGILGSLLFVATLSMIFAISPGVVLQIFGKYQQSTLNTLREVAPIASFAIIFNAMRFYLLQAALPFGYAAKANITSFMGLFVGIVLAAILAFATPLGIIGIAIGEVFGAFVAMTGLLYPWLSKVFPDSMGRCCPGQATEQSLPMDDIDDDDSVEADVIAVDSASSINAGGPSEYDARLLSLGLTLLPPPAPRSNAFFSGACTYFSNCCNLFTSSRLQPDRSSEIIDLPYNANP